ncbi:MAG TPA: hypothetical protein VHA77_03135 [Xanthobacteraceae bacterium]|jgi:hypothetical protein|nr:hypothetical protein [Xanthobacteraceae bacterium]
MPKLIKVAFVLAVAVVAVAAQQVISVHGTSSRAALADGAISPLQIMRKAGPMPTSDFDLTP